MGNGLSANGSQAIFPAAATVNMIPLAQPQHARPAAKSASPKVPMSKPADPKVHLERLTNLVQQHGETPIKACSAASSDHQQRRPRMLQLQRLQTNWAWFGLNLLGSSMPMLGPLRELHDKGFMSDMDGMHCMQMAKVSKNHACRQAHGSWLEGGLSHCQPEGQFRSRPLLCGTRGVIPRILRMALPCCAWS